MLASGRVNNVGRNTLTMDSVPPKLTALTQSMSSMSSSLIGTKG